MRIIAGILLIIIGVEVLGVGDLLAKALIAVYSNQTLAIVFTCLMVLIVLIICTMIAIGVNL